MARNNTVTQEERSLVGIERQTSIGIHVTGSKIREQLCELLYFTSHIDNWDNIKDHSWHRSCRLCSDTRT
jgi:hypothetical protein